jgi:hypothetical protein
MKLVIARLLTRLYPRRWRERYGTEFEAFLQTGRGDLRMAANVVWSALWEHIIPTGGQKMDQDQRSFRAMMKYPSAFVPMAMSLTALALVLGYVARYGAVREPDEGAIAHIWQLLMALQVPVIAFFAIKWVRRAPRQTLPVLALQAGAALVSLSAVLFLGL